MALPENRCLYCPKPEPCPGVDPNKRNFPNPLTCAKRAGIDLSIPGALQKYIDILIENQAQASSGNGHEGNNVFFPGQITKEEVTNESGNLIGYNVYVGSIFVGIQRPDDPEPLMQTEREPSFQGMPGGVIFTVLGEEVGWAPTEHHSPIFYDEY